MNNKFPIESVNIRAYLDEKHIDYAESGENISSGWIGVNCPFCPDGDVKHHLGINLASNTISCFRCRARGTVIKLVMRLESCHANIALEIVTKYVTRSLIEKADRYAILDAKTTRFDTRTELILPPNCTRMMTNAHKMYLESRGLDAEAIREKYGLMFTGHNTDWEWRHRIIIPVYESSYRMVTYTSRAIVERASPPYRYCADTQSLTPILNCVYNVENVRDTAIVVEGPFDVWNIGDGAVCGFRKRLTQVQIRILTQFKRIFILLDSPEKDPAIRKDSRLLANTLGLFVPEVYELELPHGDPADLSKDDVKQLRLEVFGRLT